MEFCRKNRKNSKNSTRKIQEKSVFSRKSAEKETFQRLLISSVFLESLGISSGFLSGHDTPFPDTAQRHVDQTSISRGKTTVVTKPLSWRNHSVEAFFAGLTRGMTMMTELFGLDSANTEFPMRVSDATKTRDFV